MEFEPLERLKSWQVQKLMPSSISLVSKKDFNSYTLTGRMNCVLATYGSIALIVLYFKLRSKKTPAVKAT